MARRKRTTFAAIVDDDVGLRAAIAALLNSSGLSTRGFASAEAFLRWADNATVGCLILDYRLPGMTGLELQRVLQMQGRAIPIIFTTAEEEAFQLLQVQASALAVLRKPFDPEELPRLVKLAVEAPRRR
jgi:FixJ family two-component response regulator